MQTYRFRNSWESPGISVWTSPLDYQFLILLPTPHAIGVLWLTGRVVHVWNGTDEKEGAQISIRAQRLNAWLLIWPLLFINEIGFKTPKTNLYTLWRFLMTFHKISPTWMIEFPCSPNVKQLNWQPLGEVVFHFFQLQGPYAICTVNLKW